MDPLEHVGERSIALQELTEAEEAVRRVEARRDLHALWSIIGVSPALIIPIALGWDWDGVGVLGLVAAAALMTGYEALKAYRANRQLPELRRIAGERRAEWEAGRDESEVSREA